MRKQRYVEGDVLLEARAALAADAGYEVRLVLGVVLDHARGEEEERAYDRTQRSKELQRCGSRTLLAMEKAGMIMTL